MTAAPTPGLWEIGSVHHEVGSDDETTMQTYRWDTEGWPYFVGRRGDEAAGKGGDYHVAGGKNGLDVEVDVQRVGQRADDALADRP